MTKQRQTKVKYLILNTGYVESTSLACLTLYHQAGGFDTVQEALEDLAGLFLKAAQRDRDTERSILTGNKNTCCAQSFDNCDLVCFSCSKNMPYLSRLDNSSLETLFLEYFSGTIDSDYTFVEQLTELDSWTLWPENANYVQTEEDNNEVTEAFRNRVYVGHAESVIASFAVAQLTEHGDIPVMNRSEEYDENWWVHQVDCANKNTKKLREAK